MRCGRGRRSAVFCGRVVEFDCAGCGRRRAKECKVEGRQGGHSVVLLSPALGGWNAEGCRWMQWEESEWSSKW